MTLELTPEQEALIRDLAQQDGKTPAQVLVEAAVWLQGFEEDEDEERIIVERLAEADRGEFLSSEERDERVRKILEGCK
jgi:predicted transcriptional regulator